MEERLVSNCCGEPDRQWNPIGVFYSDVCVCPKCQEDCQFESQREEEMKVEILTGKKDTNE
jgi:hypothetical protein